MVVTKVATPLSSGVLAGTVVLPEVVVGLSVGMASVGVAWLVAAGLLFEVWVSSESGDGMRHEYGHPFEEKYKHGKCR